MKRLTSIDATRGLVMLLMLVDHVRESFYLHAQVSDPVNLATTPLDLFLIRLSAHLCAPVFVALTGLAAWLYQSKNSKSATSEFLLKRGFFLIVLELTVVSFGWNFSFSPSIIYLQVIWAIGLSMISLSALIWLPRKALIALAIAIICGHNLLSPITFSPGEWGHDLWAILHDRTFIELSEGLKARTSYPLLPWIGVISLGYAIGPWFAQGFDSTKRQSHLLKSSLVLLSLFFIFRLTNFYGEPKPWSFEADSIQTVMSFFNLTKYPPSMDFLLLTLGVGLLFLRFLEKERRFNSYLIILGRTPMFFYVVHIYLLNILNSILKYIFGPNQGIYFSLPNVASLLVLTALMSVPMYYLCRWYGGVKRGSTNPVLKYF